MAGEAVEAVEVDEADSGLFPETSLARGLEVSLPVFEGPLELLLFLVEQEALDILAVPVASITGPYLETLRDLPRVDAVEAAEFLRLAARLLRMKSARLLPGKVDEPEEVDLDEFEELVRSRLREYRAYRRAAASLMERVEQETPAFPLPARPLPESVGVQIEQAPIDPDRLMAAFRSVLARLPPRPLSVTTLAWTVEDKVELLSLRIEAGGFDLLELMLQCEDRLEAVVTFLALLELVRQGRVRIQQARRFGPIWVKPRDSGSEPGG